MPRIRSFRPAFASAAASIALWISGSASAAIDLPSLLTRAEAATEATVFLVPAMALFRTQLDEPHMQAAACRYATTEPAAIRSLVALMKDSGLAATDVYQRPDMREGIYFALADGTLLKVLLQDNNGGRVPVTGVAGTSMGDDLQSEGVTARDTLALDIRKWTADHGGTGTGGACGRQSQPLPLPR